MTNTLPDTISITWGIEDVLQQRPDLTDQQAREVLQCLDRNHDATIGINWDVIDCVCEEMHPEQRKVRL